ncbi:MAG: SDR family NAD(P)-dependent oxidoreductase [Halobacteriaceae archaeon]
MTDSRTAALAGVGDADLTGRTALVTGATSGIGRQTTLALGSLGATVLAHGRDAEAGERLVEDLRAAESGGDAAFLRADFASQASVHELADAVGDRVDALDVIVNNAGAHFRRGRLTEDGVEATFAVNHLAPFVLTNRLAPLLANDGRVVTVSSAVHRRYRGEFDGVRSVDDYDGLDAYARSKLADVLFAFALAARLDGPTSNCCHPGFVPGSRLWRDASLPVRLAVRGVGALPDALLERVADTPASAAATQTYLAASPDVAGVTGEYFRDCEPVDPSPPARDERLRERLWDLSVELTDLDETVGGE